MSPEKNGSAETFERYLKPATFFLLLAAVAMSLVLNMKEGPTESGAATMDRITRARSDLMFRLLVVQAVNLDTIASKGDRDFIKKAIIDQLNRAEEDPGLRSPRTEVQRRIILNYTGEDTSDLSKESMGSYGDAYLGLSAHGRLPPAEDPLLSLPAARLALLSYYRAADPRKYETLLAEARDEAVRFEVFLFGGVATLGAFTLLSLFLVSRFFVRRPPPFFARLLETLSPPRRSALMESAILYFFLIFPAGIVIMRLFPARMQPLFLMGHVIATAGLAVWYFISEGGARTLLQMLWIPVVVGPSAGASAAIPEAGSAGPAEEGSISAAPQIVLHSKPFPAAREILFGIGAALVFLPMVLLKTAAAAVMGEPTAELRFAGPSVLGGELPFWAILVFGVLIIPVVEEVVFRNWLYGALRFRFSVFGAALLGGLLYAVLHPHGWWPFLLILGAGLSFLREFRPGIIAPVVAHSVLNAAALTVGLLANRI